jgi:uncharacterized protein YjlB
MNLKRNIAKTSVTSLLSEVVRPCEPQIVLFQDDGITPNNPKLPLLCYPGSVELAGAEDPAAIFEEVFQSNGWGRSWRNGIYDYLHYHSGIHEVLGIARGKAEVRFGGDHGKVVEIRAGDVAILPAGLGHERLSSSPDLLVVGAYPPEGSHDECRATRAAYARAIRSVPLVPVPVSDPVYGEDGGLVKLWRR